MGAASRLRRRLAPGCAHGRRRDARLL